MNKIKLTAFSNLKDRKPVHELLNGLDLVVTRFDDNVSVLYGRCLHRGALMADGYMDGENLICGLHGWDYRYDTGVSEYNNEEVLHKFNAYIENGTVFIDKDEIDVFAKENPQP